jgi:hypothetical protein
MQHSEQPFIELQRASDAIEAMRVASSLTDFEEQWKQFLHRVERVWNKMLGHFGRSPKWHGWASKHEHLRKADPLLSYLVNARRAEEHTVSDIVSRSPSGIGINPAEGSSLYIKKIEQRDGKLVIESPQALKIEFIPGKVGLLPVTNRGRVYPIPSSHLGRPIDPAAVVELAQIAHGYYHAALHSAESFFVK